MAPTSRTDTLDEIRRSVLDLVELAERDGHVLLAQALRVAALAADEAAEDSPHLRNARLLLG